MVGISQRGSFSDTVECKEMNIALEVSDSEDIHLLEISKGYIDVKIIL